jgi:hypothetical protein
MDSEGWCSYCCCCCCIDGAPTKEHFLDGIRKTGFSKLQSSGRKHSLWLCWPTGSVVIDAKMEGRNARSALCCVCPVVGVAVGVCCLFGRVSMARFNATLTLGFVVTRHIKKRQLLIYVTAEIMGALLASLFVKYAIGNEAFFGSQFS